MMWVRKFLWKSHPTRPRKSRLPNINDTDPASGQLAGLFGFPGVSGGDPLDQAGIHNSSIVGLDGEQSVDVWGTYLNIDYEMEEHIFSG
ncbi:MAG: hypothetical protein AAGF44_03055, partial [Pseudomonadota bacterium]